MSWGGMIYQGCRACCGRPLHRGNSSIGDAGHDATGRFHVIQCNRCLSQVGLRYY